MESIGVYEDNVDVEAFLTHMMRKVVPYLGSFAKREPNSVLVMDNAPIHHAEDVIFELVAAVKRRGAKLLFLPKYSPWLNPIERAFGQFKTALKTNKALLYLDSHAHLIAALRSVSPTNARNYMASSGCYPFTRATNRSALLVALLLIQRNEQKEDDDDNEMAMANVNF